MKYFYSLIAILVMAMVPRDVVAQARPVSPERHVLVISVDFIPENMDGLLSILRSDSKIGRVVERGALNDKIRFQPDSEDRFKAVSRVGVYASLWTGVWPEAHGVFGLDDDIYNLEGHPQLFELLKKISPETTSVVITADELIGDRLIKGFTPNSFIETSNAQVLTNATRSLTGDAPSLLWVHWGFDHEADQKDGFTTLAYKTANSFKQILTTLWTRPDFADEKWAVMLVGLPVADPGLDPSSDTRAFSIMDSVGLSSVEIPRFASIAEISPWITTFLTQGQSPNPVSSSAKVSNPGTLSPVVIPETASNLEDLSRRIEKLTLTYQEGREEQARIAQQQALEFRRRQDDLQALVMTSMSNRLTSVKDMSTSYQKFSGNVMDNSMKLALTVVVIMMVICMGTFIVTTIIQTRNSRQLAQIMQSFAAYRSRQLHKEFSESSRPASTPEVPASRED